MSEQNVESCFVAKLSHYVTLTDPEQKSVARLERNQRQLQSQQTLYATDALSDKVYGIKSGWMYSYRVSGKGARQIVQLHFPGDTLGMHELLFSHRSVYCVAVEDVTVCPMPKTAISTLASEVPDIALLICSIATREQVVLWDLVQAISKMKAQDRLLYLLLYLLLYILHRLRITNHQMSDTFRLPLNQSAIGDMLGLTNVSISNAFTALEAQGLVQRKHGYVQIHDVGKCSRQTEFIDRFSDLDISWLDRDNEY